MNEIEIKRWKQLEKRLTYERGILVAEWDELIELRTKKLTQSGENPNHWTIDSRQIRRKI